jgi:hypothetical protein
MKSIAKRSRSFDRRYSSTTLIEMTVVWKEPMSALGHKRTCAMQNLMSALPPKADICGATRDVRFGPKADWTAL